MLSVLGTAITDALYVGTLIIADLFDKLGWKIRLRLAKAAPTCTLWEFEHISATWIFRPYPKWTLPDFFRTVRS